MVRDYWAFGSYLVGAKKHNARGEKGEKGREKRRTGKGRQEQNARS